MDPLTETLKIRDLRSGRVQSLHFDFAPIYVAGRGATATDHPLFGANIGDLDKGDPVLILAEQYPSTGEVSGFELITGLTEQASLVRHPVQPPIGSSRQLA